MSKALISIIIPSYNRAHLIQETLQSVVAQSSPNWQCMVVDDGSSDDTVAVVTAFAKADARIHLFQRDDTYTSGGNGARQMGVDKAKTDWVMFLDSDDLLAKECIQNRLKAIEETVDMMVFHTATCKEKIGDSDRYWNLFKEEETTTDLLVRFLQQDMPWHTTGVLWHTSFLQKIGGWNQKLTAWQDWELHVRALTYHPRLKVHNTPADHYYRLDVADSIASKKTDITYTIAIKKAIHSIEKKVLKTHPELKRELRYLIYRNLIANPIKWKRIELPEKLLASGISFETVSKQRFIYAYWRARFYEITLIKRLLKHQFHIGYYNQLYPKTTFLKKTL